MDETEDQGSSSHQYWEKHQWTESAGRSEDSLKELLKQDLHNNKDARGLLLNSHKQNYYSHFLNQGQGGGSLWCFHPLTSFLICSHNHMELSAV